MGRYRDLSDLDFNLWKARLQYADQVWVDEGLVERLPGLLNLTAEQLVELDGFAELSAGNLVAAIEAASKPELHRFLAALGIPEVGVAVARSLARHFGTPQQEWIDQMTVAEARELLDEGLHFGAGSMAPKIEAAIDFLEGGGREVVITSPANLEWAVAGDTGTRIVH